MDRTILVKVNGHYLIKDNSRAGVQHECNAVRMRIEFDPGWDGLAKKVTFWNAAGKKPVERTLTADLLENMAVNPRAYLCPIPGEAMEIAGDMTFIIDGYVDGKRQRSLSGTLRVEAAPFIERAGEPADPTPTQAEQLQVQIEALLGNVQAETARAVTAANEAVACAETAAVSESNAVASEQAAGQHVIAAQKSADEAEIAEAGAKAAQKAAEAARDEAQQIVGGEFALQKDLEAKLNKGTASNIDTIDTDGIFTTAGDATGTFPSDIGLTIGVVIHKTWDVNYKEQMFLAYATHSVYHRVMRSAVWGDWVRLITTNDADNLLSMLTGKVSKAGDTMTGALHMAIGGGNAMAVVDSACAYIQTFKDGDSAHARTFIVRNMDYSPNLESAITLGALDDGTWKEYALIHQKNLHLIQPSAIGAVSRAGDTVSGNIEVAHNSDPSFFASNTDTGRKARTVSYGDGSVRLENHKDGRNYAGLEVKPEADDPTAIARLVVLKDGVWNPYNLIHTGNLHLLDSLLGGAKVKVGSYLGNGSYGGSSPNSIQLDFEPDLVIVQDAGMSGAMVWGMWMRGCLMFMSPSTNYSSFVQDSGKNFKWASTASAAGQFNSSGVAYGYMAISFR